jgi:hypothetical protein
MEVSAVSNRAGNRPKKPAEPPRRIRLLRVEVRPTFVLDTGDDLTEIDGPPATVTGSRWRDFAASAFTDDDLTVVLAQYDAEQAEKAAKTVL